tara:strand:+ start:30032 stop:30568 length:537 start_codon:yes stop_codon:yes gene_type:complete
MGEQHRYNSSKTEQLVLTTNGVKELLKSITPFVEAGENFKRATTKISHFSREVNHQLKQTFAQCNMDLPPSFINLEIDLGKFDILYQKAYIDFIKRLQEISDELQHDSKELDHVIQALLLAQNAAAMDENEFLPEEGCSTKCPHCGSARLIKCGKTTQGRQKYLCKDCNKQSRESLQE